MDDFTQQVLATFIDGQGCAQRIVVYSCDACSALIASDGAALLHHREWHRKQEDR